MSQHKALYIPEKQGKWQVDNAPTLQPGPDEVQIKVLATALNPVDWKMQKLGYFLQKYPAIAGSDSAGEISEVGSNVTSFKKGDKVFHQGWLTENKYATFQQYVLCPAEIVAKIPPSITVDEAATIPLGLATAAVGLYQKDSQPSGFSASGRTGLSLEPAWTSAGKGKYKGNAIVVLGGSSSVGQYAIQLARLSGFSPIITTCSAKHEEYIKSLGATHVVGRGPNAVSEIKKLLPNGAAPYVYDAISSKETETEAAEISSDDASILLTLPPAEGVPFGKRNVVNTFGNVHFQRQLGVEMYSVVTELFATGALKPNKVEIVPNGLSGISEALDRMEANKVSNVKLVAHPWE